MNPTVGFIGTGAMGTGMVERLTSVGFRALIHNRTRANAAAAERVGGLWVDSVSSLVDQADVILSCLRDGPAVESVFLSSNGVLAGNVVGKVFVEHGTFAPEIARRVAERASEHQASFIAAPVSGGPEGARSGSLAIMAGGDEAALKRARPVLDALARNFIHVGGASAGLELKMVNQLLVSAHMAVAGEAIALLQNLDIDLQVAAEILAGGWAQSAMLARSINLVGTDRVTKTGATIIGMTEVLDLVAETIAVQGLEAPVFASARERFAEAARRGFAEADPAALFRLSESDRGASTQLDDA